MASPGRLGRASSEIPLLIQRVAPRLEPHQPQGRIVLTSGTAYEIGLDASVDERGGRAGFAAVIFWPDWGTCWSLPKPGTTVRFRWGIVKALPYFSW